MRKNKQVKVSVWQKVCLITVGVFLSVVILEIGLRAGGFVLLSWQEYKNRISLKQKGAYRIMCLGESTTRGQYPRFLEEILNQRNTGVSFSVIDKGITATTTAFILSQLEANLDTYKPDMVVTMMGINDAEKLFFSDETVNEPQRPLFFRQLRVYKLLNLFYLHIAAKAKEVKPYRQKKEDYVEKEGLSLKDLALKEDIEFNSKDARGYEALGRKYIKEKRFAEAEQAFKKSLEFNPKDYFVYVELGNTYRMQEKFSEAEQSCRKAVELNPNNEQVYMELGDIYKEQGKYLEAESFCQKAIELNPGNDSAYVKLGDIYKDQRKFVEADNVYRKAIELNPGNDSAYAQLGYIHIHQNKLSEAESFYKKALKLNPKNDFVYEELGYLYMRQKKFSQMEDTYKKSIELNPNNVWGYAGLESLYFENDNNELFKEYMEKTRQACRSEYKAATINNYLKVKQVLDKRNIRLVCVQYPMLNIGPLKKIFEGQKGVVFVDNEKTFKDAVKNNGLKAYFWNMCNGEFGHCTDRGNKLLAGNIADAILKAGFKK